MSRLSITAWESQNSGDYEPDEHDRMPCRKSCPGHWGSRGIGAAIASRRAREGEAVVVIYNASPEKAEEIVQEIEAAGGRSLAVRADSADVAALRSAVVTTVETLGGIDILLNNAGILMLRTVDQFWSKTSTGWSP